LTVSMHVMHGDMRQCAHVTEHLSAHLQKLMMKMEIRVTPTFCIFHKKEIIRTVTGISEDNLKSAIAEELSNVKSATAGSAH
jgi:hypothetical protein